MNPQLNQAQSQLGAVYNPIVQGIQQQIPAIQQLYGSLLQGLQDQAALQTQNVVSSAQQRGVMRGALQADTSAALADTLGQQTTQLNLQQAGDIAGLQGTVGQANLSRVNAAQTLADTLLNQDLEARKNKLAMQDLTRKYKLDSLNAQRDFSVKEAAYAKAQAERASSGTSLTSSQALEAIRSLWKPGADGYVNPEQWNRYRKAFIDAGYSAASFNAAFKDLVNPAHQHRSNSKKLKRYSGIKLGE